MIFKCFIVSRKDTLQSDHAPLLLLHQQNPSRKLWGCLNGCFFCAQMVEVLPGQWDWGYVQSTLSSASHLGIASIWVFPTHQTSLHSSLHYQKQSHRSSKSDSFRKASRKSNKKTNVYIPNFPIQTSQLGIVPRELSRHQYASCWAGQNPAALHSIRFYRLHRPKVGI